MNTEQPNGLPSAADPAEMIGRFVRRRRERAPHEYTPWAEVSMTVPSADGLCWLVTFADGDVDVWRIDDDAARYQVRNQRLRSGARL